VLKLPETVWKAPFDAVKSVAHGSRDVFVQVEKRRRAFDSQ